MKIISTSMGFILSFDSLGDLQGTIKNLSGMEEWILSEKISSPHLYSCSDERIPNKEIQDMLDEIKNE